jgi:hypothetical protein
MSCVHFSHDPFDALLMGVDLAYIGKKLKVPTGTIHPSSM